MKSTLCVFFVQLLCLSLAFGQNPQTSVSPETKTTILYIENPDPEHYSILLWDEFGVANYVPLSDSIVIESINKRLYIAFSFQDIILDAGKPVRLRREGKFLVPVVLTGKEEAAFRFYETFRKEMGKDSLEDMWLFNRAMVAERDLKNLEMRDRVFEKVYRRNLGYLKQYQEKHKLDVAFYKTWSDLFTFKMMEERTFLQTKYDRFPKAYVEATLAAKDSLMDESLLYMRYYQGTLRNWWELGLRKATNTFPNPLKTRIAYITRNFTGQTRDFLLVQQIRGHLEEKKPFNDEFKEAQKNFNELSSQPVYKEYVNSFQKRPDVNMTKVFDVSNPEDQPVNLKEVFKRSKVNYVDVWASWCGPCIAEMRSSEILRKEYQDKGVQFIFISIDENGYNWKKAGRRLALSNSFLDKSSAFAKAFTIKEIPRYLIFDENGKVINASARRPSDVEIRKTFEALLKKK